MLMGSKTEPEVLSMARAYSLKVMGFGLALASVGSVVACGGDDSSADRENQAGTGGSSAGTSGSGGSAGSASGSAGTAGTAACSLPEAGQVCGMTATTEATLLDFATYGATGSWGVSADGDVTGGTSAYGHADGTRLTREVVDGSLHVSGNVITGGYEGFVLWLTPCLDASAYQGISFSMGGTLGGTVAKFQVQTDETYPVDVANAKGACLFTDCDLKWEQCMGPTLTLTVPETPDALMLPWADFPDGTTPQGAAPLTPDGIVGIQFQFDGCEMDGGCAIDITIGTISFME
jgi:hypothetical protein